MKRRVHRTATILLVVATACSGAGTDDQATDPSTGSPDSTVDSAVDSAPPPTATPTAPPTEPPAPFVGATGPIPTDAAASSDPRFGYHVLADGLEGASGANVADINADGFDDLAVVSFGQRPVKPSDVEPGTLTIWYQNGDPTTWLQQPLLVQDDGFYFINEPYVGDVDGDSDIDVLAGIGFFVCANIGSIGPCGALVLFENTGPSPDGVAWERTDILPNGFEQFFHRPAVDDLDGDGFLDIVAMGETFDSAETWWFPGSADGFVDAPISLGAGGGSFPTITDVDGDGDLDIASGQYFATPASAIWFENVGGAPRDGASNFAVHTITEDVGKTIQLSLVPDLDGPGTAPVWVVSNHTNTTRPDQKESGVYRLTPGADPRQPWTVTLMSQGIQSRETVGTGFQAAPGVFNWGDVDGDGDVDLAVSGDGDPRLFIIEQVAPGQYATKVLQEDFGQAGSMRIVDLNDDGVNEIVISGYEAYQLRLYTLL